MVLDLTSHWFQVVRYRARYLRAARLCSRRQLFACVVCVTVSALVLCCLRAVSACRPRRVTSATRTARGHSSRPLLAAAHRFLWSVLVRSRSKHMSAAKTHKGSDNPILNFYYTFPHALLVRASAVFDPLIVRLCPPHVILACEFVPTALTLVMH
jgi:hypothetical protein